MIHTEGSAEHSDRNANRRKSGDRNTRHRLLIVGTSMAAILVLCAICGVWLAIKASTVKGELEAASQLIPSLKTAITEDKPQDAAQTAERLQAHTSAARRATTDPLWTLASAAPVIGANFSAVTEVARSADDVATLGIAPLVKVFDSLDWDRLTPSSAETDLKPLQDAAPSVSAAAHAVRVSAARLGEIDTKQLLPDVARPLDEARAQLASVTGTLDAASSFSELAPRMMGADEPRNYLLMIQNNAEARASGGIPGALAVLTFDRGKLALTGQSSAAALGTMSPTIGVDPEQQHIYSGRLGKFMQDVNLTPDFPTAATTAQAMWERKTGQQVDGVISVDPVLLSYFLKSVGPVQVTSPELLAITGGKLPTELSERNVVKTLLSDVYAEIPRPQLQDAYFAGVAQEVFTALSAGKADAKELVEGITRGTAEGRLLLWSASKDEQTVIDRYQLGGSISGPSVSPAQFGVYFNDGTGAKMDYYIKRTVQLVKECARDGYEQTTVRITSTNTAPADAATSLPEYVTGGGIFGVPPGEVQTNIISYGPSQANIETAVIDGKKSEFASYRHGDRPVGTLMIRLAPGQTNTVELTFGKIVQHTEPKLVVTPTVQPIKEVILNNESRDCVAATKTAG